MRISDWSSDVCSSDLVDRLLTVGPTLGALRTLRDIFAITGARPLAVIREAARVRRRAGPKYYWPTDGRLLDPAAVASLAGRALGHPWLNPPSDCLPGKHARSEDRRVGKDGCSTGKSQ